jgi:hypothetical protein
MSRPMRLATPALTLSASLLLALAGGCCGSSGGGELPRAEMSDPAVFTVLHMRAAQASLSNDSGRPASTLNDLDRYFRLTPEEYKKKKLRMDDMLDSHQRHSAIAQAVARSLAIQLQITGDPAAAAAGLAASSSTKPATTPTTKTSPASDPSTSSATKDDTKTNLTKDTDPKKDDTKKDPAKKDDTTKDNTKKDGTTKEDSKKSDTPDPEAERNKLLQKLNDEMAKFVDQAEVADSPFDTLDRANDFYTALIIKSLRTYGVDSRALPPQHLYDVWTAYEKFKVAEGSFRDVQAANPKTDKPDKPDPKPDSKLPGSDAYFDVIRQMLIGPPPSPPTIFVKTPPEQGLKTPETPPAPKPEAPKPAVTVVSPPTPPFMPVPNGGDPLGGSPLFTASSVKSASDIQNLGGKIMASTAVGNTSQTQLALQFDKDAKPPQIIIEQKGGEAWASAYKDVETARIGQEGHLDGAARSERFELLKRLKETADALDANAQKAADDKNPKKDPKQDDKKDPPKPSELETARADLKKARDEYNKAIDDARQAVHYETGYKAFNGDRIIMLCLQTHVHPGIGPNRMVGMRARITSWTTSDGKTTDVCYANGNNPIKVVRLHPTRNYDLEDQLYAESLSEQLSLSVAGQFGSSVSGKIAGQQAMESAERRKFLSRIPKVCSYADAANAEFGWNFYPSNLVLHERPPADRLLGIVFPDNALPYKIDAYLEGGARDCAVYLVVPTDLASFTLQVDHVVADIDPTSETRFVSTPSGGRAVAGTSAPSTFKVTLPDFDRLEWSASLGAKVTSTFSSLSPSAAADPSGDPSFHALTADPVSKQPEPKK